jgi:hypothetical protein
MIQCPLITAAIFRETKKSRKSKALFFSTVITANASRIFRRIL